MKITKARLKQMIREELSKSTLEEAYGRDADFQREMFELKSSMSDFMDIINDMDSFGSLEAAIADGYTDGDLQDASNALESVEDHLEGLIFAVQGYMNDKGMELMIKETKKD